MGWRSNTGHNIDVGILFYQTHVSPHVVNTCKS